MPRPTRAWSRRTVQGRLMSSIRPVRPRWMLPAPHQPPPRAIPNSLGDRAARSALALARAFALRDLLHLVTVLLLDVAMQIVEARVHGLTIGRERPARNLDHLAVVQVRFLDGPFVD